MNIPYIFLFRCLNHLDVQQLVSWLKQRLDTNCCSHLFTMSKQKYCNWCEVKIQMLVYIWGQCQCWITTLWLENTAGCNTAISRACVRVYLPSLSRNTWMWGDWVGGRDPFDKNNPCSCNCCLSSSPTRAHTDTQTELGPILLPQDGSHGTLLWRSAQHDHILTNEREDSALCMSNDWQHVWLLRGISHAEFVACSCSPVAWCE